MENVYHSTTMDRVYYSNDNYEEGVSAVAADDEVKESFARQKNLLLRSHAKRLRKRRKNWAVAVGGTIVAIVMVSLITVVSVHGDVQAARDNQANCSVLPQPGGSTIVYTKRLPGNRIPHLGKAFLRCQQGKVVVNGGKDSLCLNGTWVSTLGSCRDLLKRERVNQALKESHNSLVRKTGTQTERTVKRLLAKVMQHIGPRKEMTKGYISCLKDTNSFVDSRGHCYIMKGKKENRRDAKRECGKEGGYLATKITYDFEPIMKVWAKHEGWLGLKQKHNFRYKPREGWEWELPTSNVPVDMDAIPWADGEPADTDGGAFNEVCGYMWTHGGRSTWKIHDTGCSGRGYPICEYEPTKTIPNLTSAESGKESKKASKSKEIIKVGGKFGKSGQKRKHKNEKDRS